MFLDSGASYSVVRADYVNQSEIKPVTATKLINADGRNIIPHGTTTMTVTLGYFSVKQPFIVVEHLSIPSRALPPTNGRRAGRKNESLPA